MKIFYLLVFVVVLSSCFKRNETEPNKICTDSCMTFNISVGTGENSLTKVKDADVELSWSSPQVSLPFGDPGRLIGKGKTNNLGIINFSFKSLKKELKGGQYSVVVKNNKDGFQPYLNYFNITRYDTTINSKLHLPTKAFINIVYKNFHPANNNGYFQVTPFYKDYGSSNLGISLTNKNGGLANSFFSGNEAFDRTELNGVTAGNQYTYFSILKKKNGLRIELLDSVYVSTGQTKTYEVEY